MAIWNNDNRKDFFEIRDEQVEKNTGCVAAILSKDGLMDNEDGSWTLKHKNYGETFNLCENEPFRDQPIVSSSLPTSTGFLVGEDIIATAGQSANERNVTSLRFVFGFRMEDPHTPVIRAANENIYKGVKIIRRVYELKGDRTNWALVKVDRKVEDRPVARLSRQDISIGQPVYVIGHPCGLPLKYAPGASVRGMEKAYFIADPDVYSGNSGSPVCDGKTHEVIGMVVRTDPMDFRQAGKCWVSVIYPDPGINSRGAECTRVSEFIDMVHGLE